MRSEFGSILNNKKVFPYLMVAPVMLLFGIFSVYPIVEAFKLSFFSKVAGIDEFVGSENYKRLFTDGVFITALKNTFTLLVFQVPVMITMALILANILNLPFLKFRNFFRVSFFMPVVSSLVAYSIIFAIMLMGDGVINQIVQSIGFEKIPWLSNPIFAKAALILAMTWRWTGYNMVIFLAGLQNIDESIYEAVEIDGATKVKKLFYITIPQLKPVIVFTTVLSTLGTLQLFDEPYTLTNGGPNDGTLTLGMYIYKSGFRFYDFGYACAIAYVVVILIAGLSYLQLRLAGDGND